MAPTALPCEEVPMLLPPPQTIALPGFHEPFNAFSHLLGAGVFAVLTPLLVRRARGDRLRQVLLGVFAVTSVLLLSMSGVFHMLREGTAARDVLGRLDKAAIFALIAGTHTPVQGLYFRGAARWGVMLLMWLVAVTGITLFSVFYHDLPAGLGTGVYLAMGWIAAGAGLVAWRRRVAQRFDLLVWGGVVYSVGAVLLGLDRPILVPGVVGAHELWHVAVLVAMALHWRFFWLEAHRPAHGPLRSSA